jgi:hypothetical protein
MYTAAGYLEIVFIDALAVRLFEVIRVADDTRNGQALVLESLFQLPSAHLTDRLSRSIWVRYILRAVPSGRD